MSAVTQVTDALPCNSGQYCQCLPGTTDPCPCGQCTACRLGEYCPAGAAWNPLGDVFTLRCPAGSYCPDPTKRLDCPAGFFCPVGTFNYTLFVCVNKPAQYCPANSSAPTLCPKGTYCPTPQESITCPNHYYCVEGVHEARACTPTTSCPEGSHSPAISPLGLFLVVIVVLARIIVYYFYFFVRTQRRLLQAEAPESPTTASQFQRGSFDSRSYMEVKFRNMSVTLSDGKAILSSVNGQFRPGRMCAVMGPSGAGKSTLLTALLGLNSGKIGGVISVNGKESTLQDYRAQVAFVPQDDIVLSELTVSDNLYYSCLWRQPAGTTAAQRTTIIDRTIKMLGLSHVKDTIVGDPEQRGISGGQRKRVNIGIELVASPTVLFLDEPTSGLDSTSSLDILSSLKAMAEDSGLTIAAVIHQPRISIFNMFDDVLLLAKGGRTVYMGTTKDVLHYFEDVGYRCPPMENPADFLMDVIAGIVEPADGREKPDLVAAWHVHERSLKLDDDSTPPPTVHRDSSPWYAQITCYVKRTVNQILRRPMDLFVDFLLICLGASGCGFVFGPNGSWKFTLLEPVILFSVLILGLLTCMASLNVFGGERLFFFRECPAGVNVLAYFCAKNVVYLYDVFLRSFIYAGVFYNFVQFYMTFRDYYLMCAAVTWACGGLGFLISIVTNPRNALLAAVVVPFVLGGMFSGFIPSLKDLKASGFMTFVSFFSFGRWALEGLAVIEDRAYPTALRGVIDDVLGVRGYVLEAGTPGKCAEVLILLGFIFRIVAFLVMYFTTPNNRIISRTIEKITTMVSRKPAAEPQQKAEHAQPLLDL